MIKDILRTIERSDKSFKEKNKGKEKLKENQKLEEIRQENVKIIEHVKKIHLASQVVILANTANESDYLDWWTKYNKQEKNQQTQKNETLSISSNTLSIISDSKKRNQKDKIVADSKNELKSKKSKKNILFFKV